MAEFGIDQAVACFAGGFAAVRNFLRPCEVTLLADQMWMVRDSIDPNSKKKQEPRVTEIYPLGLAADYVLATALKIHEKTYICAVVPDGDIPASTVNEYKACGCRYLRSEGLYCVEAKSALLNYLFGGLPPL